MSPSIWRLLSRGVLPAIVTLLCGCGGDDYDGALGGRRLVRTPLEGEWIVKEFPYSGVSAEIPTATDLQWVRDSGRAYIGMHAAVLPPRSPSDPQLLLEITLERMSREEFEEPGTAIKQSASYQEGDEDTRRFWDWVVSRHEAIERYDFKGYTYFQYEITCADETLVRINTELVNLRQGGVAVYEVEDEAAIRRILNSVKCIEQEPLPERPTR